MVVNKPAGWWTIPGRARSNLLGAREDPHPLAGPLPSSFSSSPPILLEWATQQAGGGRLWVVHRLDQDTSGVLLFARTPEAHAQANSWFLLKKIKKIYWCLAAGKPAAPLFKLTHAVAGKPAVSLAEVLEQYGETFLAEIRPASGRRHQIRIHLAQAGFPLLGDTTYGGPLQVAPDWRVTRVALHALRLVLPSGESFECPLPADFQGWRQSLKAMIAPAKPSGSGGGP